jgi:hypothetical protein
MESAENAMLAMLHVFGKAKRLQEIEGFSMLPRVEKSV